MSNKLRVGSTVAESFRIGVAHWFDSFRFFLVPTLIAMALVAALIASAVDWSAFQAAAAADADVTPQELDDVLRIPVPAFLAAYFGFILIAVLLFAGPSASFCRLAALGENRAGWLGVRFDSPARNLILAHIVLILIAVGVFALGFAAASVVTGTSLSDWAGLSETFQYAALAEEGELSDEAIFASLAPFYTAYAFCIIPTVYLQVKLTILPAAAAIEDRVPLADVFMKTFGSWWSIWFTFLLFAAAFIALVLIGELGLFVLFFVGTLLLQAQAWMQALGAMAIVAGLILFIGVMLVASAAHLALPAIIYRRLMSEAPDP